MVIPNSKRQEITWEECLAQTDLGPRIIESEKPSFKQNILYSSNKVFLVNYIKT